MMCRELLVDAVLPGTKSLVRDCRHFCAGAEPQKFDRFAFWLFEVDVGVRREIVRTQHISLTRMLHAQLRADER